MEVYISIAIGIISLITFLLYAVDKHRAVQGAWRVPEKVLLGFSILGGGIGGLLAMQLVRHKTKHWYFNVINWIAAVGYIALLVWLWLR